jgi:hypothetical protein
MSMPNAASQLGGLQRAGIRKAPQQKRLVGSRRRRRALKQKESYTDRHIFESNHGSFFEKGEDEVKDNKKCRVYLVTIIGEGLGNSKDKNYYSAQALKNAPPLFNGAKAYADHPDAIQEKTLPERSMKDLVAWYSDSFTDAGPDGKTRLRAKLHFFPSAKWLTDMIDTILTDPSAKNLFGISINAIGKTRPANMGGEVVNYVEAFQRVDSADVVTEPAARGKFDKMLESRRGQSNRATKTVSRSVMRKRTRESGVPPEKAKEVADSLVAAYNSDSPDEVKQAAYDAAKQLYGYSSISGKGSGQQNEEQFSNINPSGGNESMAKPRLKASRGGKVGLKLRFKKSKKRLQASDGTGPDNETVDEPDPGDINIATESDVEGEEGEEDLGAFDDFGDSSKKVQASRRRGKESLEDESLEEDEDEGFEDEAPPSGAGAPQVMGDGDDDEDDDGDGGMSADGVDDDLGEALEDEGEEGEEDEGLEGLEDEGEEDEGLEDEDDAEMGSVQSPMGGGGGAAPPIAEARRRSARSAAVVARRRGQEAGFSGGLGKSGKSSLPSHAIGDYDEDYETPDKDSSSDAVGKSYKLKTSKYRKNRLARKVAHEANRRIEVLESTQSRLRESLKAARRQNERLSGIIAYNNSKRSAIGLLREAVKDEILDVGMARVMAKQLYGMNRDDQIQEIEKTARLIESSRRSAISSLRESVEGNGARGTVAFRQGTSGGKSELVEGFAADGIPMK